MVQSYNYAVWLRFLVHALLDEKNPCQARMLEWVDLWQLL